MSVDALREDADRDRSGGAARKPCAAFEKHTLDTIGARDRSCPTGTASSWRGSYVKGLEDQPESLP